LHALSATFNLVSNSNSMAGGSSTLLTSMGNSTKGLRHGSVVKLVKPGSTIVVLGKSMMSSTMMHDNWELLKASRYFKTGVFRISMRISELLLLNNRSNLVNPLTYKIEMELLKQDNSSKLVKPLTCRLVRELPEHNNSFNLDNPLTSKLARSLNEQSKISKLVNSLTSKLDRSLLRHPNS